MQYYRQTDPVLAKIVSETPLFVLRTKELSTRLLKLLEKVKLLRADCTNRKLKVNLAGYNADWGSC